MPRPPRLNLPDTNFYVTLDGRGGRDLFLSDDDRVRYIAALSDCLGVFGVRLFAGALLRARVELLVRPGRANLTRFMQRLQSMHGVHMRLRRGQTGRLFDGRYGCRAVEDGDATLRVTRHIHLAPVKRFEGEALPAALRGSRLEAYQWSTYRAWAGLAAPPPWLDLAPLGAMGEGGSGKGHAAAQAAYRRYVAECLTRGDETLEAMLAAGRGRASIGGAKFVKQIKITMKGMKKHEGKAMKENVKSGATSEPRAITLDDVDRAVCAHFGEPRETLSAHGLRAGAPKQAAIEAACRLTGLTHREIGAHYGGMTGQAVSMLRRKLRRDAARGNRETAAIVDEISASLGVRP